MSLVILKRNVIDSEHKNHHFYLIADGTHQLSYKNYPRGPVITMSVTLRLRLPGGGSSTVQLDASAPYSELLERAAGAVNVDASTISLARGFPPAHVSLARDAPIAGECAWYTSSCPCGSRGFGSTGCSEGHLM